MPQFAPVLTSASYSTYMRQRSAMEHGVRESVENVPHYAPDTLELAHSLALQIPEFDWTIEVDVLGSHRITVHFKGASVSLDEPV